MLRERELNKGRGSGSGGVWGVIYSIFCSTKLFIREQLHLKIHMNSISLARKELNVKEEEKY